MPIIEFPDHEYADDNGLIALGGDLAIESLLLAYSNGIFPWPLNNKLLAWFSPPKRAIIYFDEFHISRSLERERRKKSWTYSLDQDFASVIKHCANSTHRTGQQGTWITSDIITAYINLHKAGFAHSVECYFGGKLVGGMYGVSIGKMFAGESMFFTRPNASKLALCHLIDVLKVQGLQWMDCQVMNPNIQRFGAREVKRNLFLKMLEKALKAT